jgi:hypothetical protein
MTTKGFDARCYQLARYFMPHAAEPEVEELAQTIQDTIEEHLEIYAAANGGMDLDG